MRKVNNTAIIFTITALLAGVYSRELPKYTGAEGPGVLGAVHPHLLILGAVIPLVIGFMLTSWGKSTRDLRWAWPTYLAGVVATVTMLLVRGTLTVLSTPLSRGLDGMISGIAGLTHMLLAVGIVALLYKLRPLIPVGQE